LLLIVGLIIKMGGKRVVSGRKFIWAYFLSAIILVAGNGGAFLHTTARVNSPAPSFGADTASTQASGSVLGGLLLVSLAAFVGTAFFAARPGHRALLFLNIQRHRVISTLVPVLRDRGVPFTQTDTLFRTSFVCEATAISVSFFPTGCRLSVSGLPLDAEVDFLEDVAIQLKRGLESDGEYVRLRLA